MVDHSAGPAAVEDGAASLIEAYRTFIETDGHKRFREILVPGIAAIGRRPKPERIGPNELGAGLIAARAGALVALSADFSPRQRRMGIRQKARAFRLSGPRSSARASR
jgi:hypothetical protein